MEQPHESRDQVLAYAAGFGFAVSAAQLARWHRAGILPSPRQRSLGRGRGTETAYPPGTSLQLVALCKVKEHERRLSKIAFQLWWEGFTVDLLLIREQIKVALESQQRGIQAIVTTTRPASGIETIMRRSLGSDRIEAIVEEMREAAKAGNAGSATISWPPSPVFPPRLDDLADLVKQAATVTCSGTPAAEVVLGASDSDLVRARDRIRTMLEIMRSAAEPLAWLYGKGGSFFRLMSRLLDSLEPSSYPDLVGAMLILMTCMPTELLGVLDSAVPEPPLARELNLIMAIRDQVPGAKDVLTPMAIRAVLRDKEAASRHRPKIEQFVSDHSDEISEVVASVQQSVIAEMADD